MAFGFITEGITGAMFTMPLFQRFAQIQKLAHDSIEWDLGPFNFWSANLGKVLPNSNLGKVSGTYQLKKKHSKLLKNDSAFAYVDYLVTMFSLSRLMNSFTCPLQGTVLAAKIPAQLPK